MFWKSTFWGVLGLTGLFLFSPGLIAQASWEDTGAGRSRLQSVWVDPSNGSTIFTGGEPGVLRSQDAGASWKRVLIIRGKNSSVNAFAGDGRKGDVLYAATGDGLFATFNRGESWKRIFKGSNILERDCMCLLASYPVIYLGTKAGLFVSLDSGRSWRREKAGMGDTPVVSISGGLESRVQVVYVSSIQGLFLRKGDSSWTRVFALKDVNNENSVDDGLGLGNEEEISILSSGVRYVAIDPARQGRVYFSAKGRVFRSNTFGASWEPLGRYGLFGTNVRSLWVNGEPLVYAVLEKGIFKFTGERWIELSLGLGVNSVNSIGLDKNGVLYAATDKGLFKTNDPKGVNVEDIKVVDMTDKSEPQIDGVQQAAVKYAEVDPEKILQWRRLAGRKALLPKISTGINRDTSDLWHWESGSTTKTGDDILARGKETVSWDVTLSWDLSELVWSSEQTSIDVRSKLMVELRNDILDEVTKLYFERLRAKMEMDSLQIGDKKKLLEKELKVRELTASLDALTGGYFSRELNKSKI